MGLIYEEQAALISVFITCEESGSARIIIINRGDGIGGLRVWVTNRLPSPIRCGDPSRDPEKQS